MDFVGVRRVNTPRLSSRAKGVRSVNTFGLIGRAIERGVRRVNTPHLPSRAKGVRRVNTFGLIGRVIERGVR